MDDLLNILQEFSNTYSYLANELISNIIDNIKNGMEINKSVDSALESTDFIYKVEDELISSVISCFILNYNVDNEDELRDILLYTPWIGNVSLDERLTIIGNSLSTNIKDSINSNNLLIYNIVNYISSDNVDIEELRKKINMISVFCPKDDFNKILVEVNKYSKDKDNTNLVAIISLLMVIYIPIFTNILNKILNVGYKDRYVGLNNTEGARANYEAMVKKTKNEPNLFGYRWVLSPAHYRFPFDICDVNANANVGYGKGIYRKDKVPVYPAHKHCMCIIKPVYKNDVGKKLNNKFNDNGIIEYIDKLSLQDRNRLFNKSNLDNYSKSKNYKLMNSYSGYEVPKSRT